MIRYSTSAEQRLAAVIQLDEVKNRTVQEIAALAVVATEDLEPEIREDHLAAALRLPVGRRGSR